MTIVAAYKRDNYSILATDTRTGYGINHESIIFHTDSYDKLLRTNFGWCCGIGSGAITELFQAKIKQHPITEVSGFAKAFNETYSETRDREFPDDEADYHTKVFFTYWTVIDNKLVPRIGVLGKAYGELGEQAVSVEEGKLFVAFPSGLTVEQMDDLLGRYRSAMSICNNMLDAIFVISEMTREVAGLTRSVSAQCDIGISIQNGGEVAHGRLMRSCEEVERLYIEGKLANAFVD